MKFDFLLPSIHKIPSKETADEAFHSKKGGNSLIGRQFKFIDTEAWSVLRSQAKDFFKEHKKTIFKVTLGTMSLAAIYLVYNFSSDSQEPKTRDLSSWSPEDFVQNKAFFNTQAVDLIEKLNEGPRDGQNNDSFLYFLSLGNVFFDETCFKADQCFKLVDHSNLVRENSQRALQLSDQQLADYLHWAVENHEIGLIAFLDHTKQGVRNTINGSELLLSAAKHREAQELLSELINNRGLSPLLSSSGNDSALHQAIEDQDVYEKLLRFVSTNCSEQEETQYQNLLGELFKMKKTELLEKSLQLRSISTILKNEQGEDLVNVALNKDNFDFDLFKIVFEHNQKIYQQDESKELAFKVVNLTKRDRANVFKLIHKNKPELLHQVNSEGASLLHLDSLDYNEKQNFIDNLGLNAEIIYQGKSLLDLHLDKFLKEESPSSKDSSFAQFLWDTRVSIKTMEGFHGLLEGIKFTNSDIPRFTSQMVSLGLDVNQPVNGKKLITRAIEKNYLELVRALVARGAQVISSDIEFAKGLKSPAKELIEFLEEKQASYSLWD